MPLARVLSIYEKYLGGFKEDEMGRGTLSLIRGWWRRESLLVLAWRAACCLMRSTQSLCEAFVPLMLLRFVWRWI